MSRTCNKCLVEMSIDNFSIRSDNGRRRLACKQCESKRKSIYARNSIDRRREYLKVNKEILAEKHRNYYVQNRIDILEQKKVYYTENKKVINGKTNTYLKSRRATDPSFKMRHYISCSIRLELSNLLLKKSGKSCFKYLGYSVEDLKNHIQALFEGWMNWDNWGVYDSTSWQDDDPATWTWQLDHIIPHSTFKYKDMECEEFKRCWQLSNLRPLSAKQNHIDGVTRSRHVILAVGDIYE